MGGSERNYLTLLKRKKCKVLRENSVMARGHEMVVLSNLCFISDYKPTSDDQLLKMNTKQKTALRGAAERGRYVKFIE